MCKYVQPFQLKMGDIVQPDSRANVTYFVTSIAIDSQTCTFEINLSEGCLILELHPESRVKVKN